MHVTLSTETFDLLGVVRLHLLPTATLGKLSRRMNRVATLDGGAVINDSGYSEADRSIDLVWIPTAATQEAAVVRLVQLYARLHVATPQGLFLAAIESYTPGAGESRLSLLVIDKLA